MAIFGVFIINRAGGLIYDYDHNTPLVEVEKTLSYPPELVLKIYDEKVVVAFGQRDGIKVGHTVLAVNGIPTVGRQLERPLAEGDEERDVLKILDSREKYPLDIRFGRTKLTTNEKIMLAGMFHSLFAISSQLSPVPQSSGIQVLETDIFRLHCSQTLTGIKFVVTSDIRQGNQEGLLRRLYELYADFALKNPFYSLDMPIRCEKFDENLRSAVEMAEKIGLGPV
eukprot:GHVU01037714.1.p1 GENE.GHVU01037714.1~~GHVU01037714.1.p1  ORF type:complete len:225 (+),score=28.69 GHVU01037714.1:90-764(+)